MLRIIALTLATVTSVSLAAAPQAPASAPARAPQAEAPREQAPAKAQEPAGQQVNIKLDITVSDQRGPGAPSKKTVSMVVADRNFGSIRTGGTQILTESGAQPININVDATPTIVRDGSIRVQFGFEYQPRPGGDPAQANATPPRMSQVNQRLVVFLQDGRPLTITQAADAASDRNISVEIKATVMK